MLADGVGGKNEGVEEGVRMINTDCVEVKAIRYQVSDQVSDQVRNQVRNEVRNEVWHQVEYQVWAKVWWSGEGNYLSDRIFK